jgi:hypothetical protein
VLQMMLETLLASAGVTSLDATDAHATHYDKSWSYRRSGMVLLLQV